ncbi:hypothetical protein Q7P37_008270 [Cladosporium fusiforme]
MSKPIAFIIGAGQRVGASTAEAFRSKGYRIALASRSLKPEDSTEDSLLLSADFTKPASISETFTSIRKQWGEPSVIVYNAAGAHFTAADDPAGTSISDFEADIAINTTSLYAAVKEALASFATLPSSAARTFLYTGNKLNEGPAPGMLTLGVGKVASAQVIQLAAAAYGKSGYQFFYVDERKADGASKDQAVDGPAHGEFFVSLVERAAGEVPWQATFVAGQGYVNFNKA